MKGLLNGIVGNLPSPVPWLRGNLQKTDFAGNPLGNTVAATRRAYFLAITCTKAAIKNVTLMPPPTNWGIKGPRQPK
jgi:hypothetical protein